MPVQVFYIEFSKQDVECGDCNLGTIPGKTSWPDNYWSELIAVFFVSVLVIYRIASKGKQRNLKPMVMNKLKITALVLLLVTLTGCELVGDIFEAGVWVGVLLVVVVIAGILFLFRKISGK